LDLDTKEQNKYIYTKGLPWDYANMSFK
jgi:hypothetical protein